MPSVMRGSLTIDDWKPLIAASLIFAGIKRPRRALRFITTLASLEGLILIFVKYNTDDTTGLTIAAFFFISTAVIILGVLKYMKTLWLQADAQAATLVGRDSFVASLTKIQAMNLSGINSNRGFDIPTIEERIKNLLQTGS